MDQNWSKLLDFLYNSEDNWEYYGRGDQGITFDHPLVEKTDLSKSEVQAGISFLRKHDLIEVDDRNSFEITTKGFDVARERESQKSQVVINRHLLIVTVVLAITSMIQVFHLVYSNYSSNWVFHLLGLFIGCTGGYLLSTVYKMSK